MHTTFKSILSTGIVFACALVSTASGGELVVSIDENWPHGASIVNLHREMKLDHRSRLQLAEGASEFQIDDHGHLRLSEGASIDFENRSEYRLYVKVVAPLQADALRERFVAAITESGVDERRLERLRRSRYTVPVRILVRDVEEPPRLLGKIVWNELAAPLMPGQVVGRAVGVDDDRDDQLTFDLPEENPYFRVDSSTGELAVRSDVALPAVSELDVTVTATDAAGLSTSQSYAVRINRAPAWLPFEIAPPPETGLVETADPLAIGAPDEPDTSNVVAVETTAELPPPPPETESSDSPQTTASAQNDPQVAEVGEPTVDEDVASATPDWAIWVVFGCGITVLAACGFRLIRLVRRNRALAAVLEKHESGTTETVTAGRPQDVAALLAELDDSFNADSQAGEGAQQSGLEHVGDLMSDVLSAAGLMIGGEGTADVVSATTIAPPESGRNESGLLPDDPEEDATGHPLRRATDRQPEDERDRLEEFRRISRASNRADITRHHRERMLDQWMSVGVTAVACLITGTICVFTNCFGNISVPIGSVLFSVAAILLMRRSLYPRLHNRRVEDRLSHDER